MNIQPLKIVCLSVLLSVGLVGCGKKSSGPVSYQSPYVDVMSTLARCTAIAGDEVTAAAAVKAAIEKLRYVEEVMSDYNPDSQLYKVNQMAFDGPVKVDDDLMYVITESIRYSELTGGEFDVTVGPVVDLWHKAGENNKKPSDEEIAEAKSKVGYQKLIIDTDNGTIGFSVEGMRIDLGGIAKGYSIDLAVEAMKAAGAIGGIVDVGGDIRCFGKPVDKKYWMLGLQDPREENLVLVLNVNDNAVATSGDYRRFVEVDGQKYSHIVDPGKGGSASELSSVTIIAPTAIAADALATSVTVVGAEEGIKLIDGIDQTETIIIPNKPELDFISTKGARKYVNWDSLPDGYTEASVVSGL